MLKTPHTGKAIRSSRGSCVRVDTRVLGWDGKASEGDLCAFIVMS